ncbi:Nn.00g020990.m01.CDS01 [Neocucurbitaria sp. VM-36]
MAEGIQGPGVLWVTSRIASSAKDVLDERSFLHWYDDDHIAEIMGCSGTKDAFRYVHIDKESALGSEAVPKPFLAFYPMPDLRFTQTEEFRQIRVRSDILPGSGIIYDLADIDVGYLGLMQKSEGPKKKEPAQYILTSAVEPASGTSDDDVNKFYNEQTATISKAPGYLRSLCFKLVYARTNAHSRALKGLQTTNEPNPEPPTWLALHEFSSKPSIELKCSVEEDQNDVLKRAKQKEIDIYRLAKVHGNGKFFE